LLISLDTLSHFGGNKKITQQPRFHD